MVSELSPLVVGLTLYFAVGAGFVLAAWWETTFGDADEVAPDAVWAAFVAWPAVLAAILLGGRR